MARASWVSRIINRDNNQCTECGSDNSLIVYNHKTLCRICHAEAIGQTLAFTHVTKELIIDIERQGFNRNFTAKHLGITRQRIWSILRE